MVIKHQMSAPRLLNQFNIIIIILQAENIWYTKVQGTHEKCIHFLDYDKFTILT